MYGMYDLNPLKLSKTSIFVKVANFCKIWSHCSIWTIFTYFQIHWINFLSFSLVLN